MRTHRLTSPTDQGKVRISGLVIREFLHELEQVGEFKGVLLGGGHGAYLSY